MCVYFVVVMGDFISFACVQQQKPQQESEHETPASLSVFNSILLPFACMRKFMVGSVMHRKTRRHSVFSHGTGYMLCILLFFP